MTIKNEDLIINKPERMTQFDDGGGKITGLLLQNNKSNEIFGDVTAIDRVSGKIEYGKLFASVKTYGDKVFDEEGNPINGADGQQIITQETLQSAGVIITKNPEDPNIHALLFSTDDHYDEVSEIKSRIESHMIKATRISGELVGRQPAGSKSIRIAQNVSARAPSAGDTVFIIQDEEKITEISEPIKIEKVTISTEDVMIQVGNDLRPVKMNMINMSLYYPLIHSYDGGEITGNDSVTKRAFLRSAQISDATIYKGAKQLKEETAIGDLRVKIDSPFGQLAPPSEGQANIVDMQAGTDMSPLIASGGSSSLSTPEPMGAGSSFFLGIGVLPDTLKINYSGGVLVDVGGQIKAGETVVGTINYRTGLLLFSISSPIFNGSKTITFDVATTPPKNISQTEAIRVSENNRSDTYNINLFPIPEPGGLFVDYIAMGQRYRLIDRGDGILESDGAGVGTINYKTGSVSCTFAAIVDANTSVVFSFANKVDYMNRGKDYQNGTIPAQDLRAKFKKELKGKHILRGSVVLKYKNNKGDEITVRDDGAGKFKNNEMDGDIDYINGIIELFFVVLPGKGAVISVEYEEAGSDTVKTESLSGYAVSIGSQRVQLESTNIRPRSVRIEFNIQAQKDDKNFGVNLMSTTITAYDDGNGKLLTSDNKDAGTVDYETGILNIKTAQQAVFWVPQYSHRPRQENDSQSKWGIYAYQYETLWGMPPSDGSQFIDIKYAVKGDDSSGREDLNADSYSLNLTPTFQEHIVPGSVLFNFGGRQYYDVDGALYADMNKTTGAGSYSGLINYQSGELTLLGWNIGESPNIKVISLLTMLNYVPISGIDFIIPTAPIRPGSLMIRATREDGVRLEATANENGEIKAPSMQGKVDNKTGIVSVDFGQYVDVVGNEGEEWFDPSNIEGDKIWQPFLVMIETIKYNVVSTIFSPVDPKVLGISLVLLPIDGRVQIFRSGDLVVLHETYQQIFPINVPAGHVVKFGIELIDEIWAEDANGKRVDCKKFEIDQKKGEMKIIDNDFTGYEMPITGFALIEEENSVTDAQITGVISLRKPIRHKFTKNAMISGLMYIGNMQARYNSLFEQSTWKTDEWSDIPNGRPNWRYNDQDYPLIVTNADTVKERWALLFYSPTEFRIYGENLGLIGVGSTSSDCVPINQNTGAPYFRLKKQGWGQGGQAAGNVLRFNTIAANQPFWITRSVVPSDEVAKSDSFSFRFRGFKSGESR